MNTQPRVLWRTASLLDLAFPTLTITFGLQLLRVMIPSVVYVYGEREGTSSIDMGLFVLVAFLLAFLAPVLPRLLGLRRALWGAAGGVSLLRLILQLVPDPNARLWIGTVGVIDFLFFVPIFVGYVRGVKLGLNFGMAFLVGFALDTALHGAFGTYDYAWTISAVPIILAVALALVHLWLMRRFMTAVEPAAHSDGRSFAALPLAGFGMALFLQAVLWQNVARHAATLELDVPIAFLLVMAGNVIALIVGAYAMARPSRIAWALTLVAAAGLLIAAVASQGGSVPGLILAHAAMAVLLIEVGRSLAASADRPGVARSSIAWGLGAFLFVLISLLYYISFDLNLPFSNTILPPIAAALLGLAGIGARLAGRESESPRLDWSPAVVGAALLVIPLAAWLTRATPSSVPGDGTPVRVMSYNIHHGGFDAGGWLGMEAIAQAIESTGAEVIALQEVSRGWYINASVDSLDWLSTRLNLPYIYAGAGDVVWGNAILSRYPIRNSGSARLPQGGVAFGRGYLWAEIDVGGGESLYVIATHLHHTGDEKGEQVRLLQFPVVIEAWGGRENGIVMGDLNAEPDSPVLDLARDAGLIDAFAAAGSGEGFTFRSDRRYQRIDYILLSSHLSASDFQVIDSTASDHLGIAVTVSK